MADSLVHAFERYDAGLSLIEGRLASELDGEGKLNPSRILRRLAALEAELPRLRAAAEQNAAARRQILAPLLGQQCANQEQALHISRRAQADVAGNESRWRDAHAQALRGLAECGLMQGQSAAVEPAPPLAESGEVHPATRVTEDQWLRLPKELTAHTSLVDVNRFYQCLRGHFVRREVSTTPHAASSG